MRPALLALAALAVVVAAPMVSAQEPSDGFDRLDGEIRERLYADALYSRQLEAAWTDALNAAAYARADSIAVLARLAMEEDIGLPYDSLAWPGPADALALRFLRGDRAALDWIADDGRWWGGFLTYDGESVIVYGRDAQHATPTVRPASQTALRRDRDRILGLLREVGATTEDLAAAGLAISRLTGDHEWRDSVYVLANGQDALNDSADAFLAQFPGSRYERYVRREVRHRYRLASRFAFHGGLGGGGGASRLGSETKIGFGLNLGAGVRFPWMHADLAVRASQLPVRESIVRAGGEIVEGEALGTALVGVSGGPRLASGPIQVLPYVMGGVLLQDVGPITAEGEDVETLSTYDPPSTLSWGYGLAMEVHLGADEAKGLRYGLRLDVGRLHPQHDGGFEDALAGSVTTATLGLTVTNLILRRTP